MYPGKRPFLDIKNAWAFFRRLLKEFKDVKKLEMSKKLGLKKLEMSKKLGVKKLEMSKTLGVKKLEMSKMTRVTRFQDGGVQHML